MHVFYYKVLFLDLLDPAKKFSLMSQYEDFSITEMVEQLDDMFLAYSIMKQRLERHPNIILNLPHMNKVASGIKAK